LLLGCPFTCLSVWLQEAERLSTLPALVILDLAGNPMISCTEDYRLLLLYRLRHLKVLDGTPAQTSELALARAKYSGRLTMSFLVRQSALCHSSDGAAQPAVSPLHGVVRQSADKVSITITISKLSTGENDYVWSQCACQGDSPVAILV
jgi:hypothetical protein